MRIKNWMKSSPATEQISIIPAPEPPADASPPRRIDEESAARRVLVAGYIAIGLFSVGLLGIIVRVVQLKIHPSPSIARLIGSQRSTTRLHGRRGNITDRQGRIIASTGATHRLFVDPVLIEDPGTFSERVGYALGYDPAQIERTISQRLDSRYIVLDDRLDDARFALVQAMDLPGLATQVHLVREYPLGALAGQVIGFVGVDGTGLEGIELAFDSRLQASHGTLQYMRDNWQRPTWVRRDDYEPPSDGKVVSLSLDVMIQSIAEEELADTCSQFNAQGGQIIVMVPATGQILAMANHPPFNPNEFKQSALPQRRNRCVTDAYEPGSTFKAIIWSAALNAGLVQPENVFDCTSGGLWISPEGRRLRDVRGHGSIGADMILIKSSNIGMAQIGLRLGDRRLYEAVRAFGFGRSTGSGLPGESSGIVNPLHRWNHYSVTSVPMGQEIAVTSLQLARAFCVIANGGLMIVPTLRFPDEELRTPIYERVLSVATADHTRDVLHRVVTEGTGKKANSDLYPTFGKTGTAEVPNPNGGGYLADQYVSSFVGAAPLKSPQIVVLVCVQRPEKTKGYYGGTVAAPCVRRVIEKTLTYMGVAPESPSGGRGSALALAR